MAKFNVKISADAVYKKTVEKTVTIEAEDEKEAEDLAWDELRKDRDLCEMTILNYDEFQFDDYEWNSCDIECISGDYISPCKLTIDMFEGLYL